MPPALSFRKASLAAQRCVLWAAAALCLALPCRAQRMVFAHYMLTNQDYQGDTDPTQEAKIAAYQREIREA
jgi:hypothetical protein